MEKVVIYSRVSTKDQNCENYNSTSQKDSRSKQLGTN